MIRYNDSQNLFQMNPGQYTEKSPGQVDVENIQVDFQHSTDIR